MIAILNQASVLGSDLFYYIILEEKKGVNALFGFLNSSIGAMLGELYGRSYGGGVLDVKVYEAKQMPVIDPSELDKDEEALIEQAAKGLAKAINERIKAEDVFETAKPSKKGQLGLLEVKAREMIEEAIEVEKDAQKALDKTIYDVLDFTEKERNQVEEGLKELQELRMSRTKL